MQRGCFRIRTHDQKTQTKIRPGKRHNLRMARNRLGFVCLGPASLSLKTAAEKMIGFAAKKPQQKMLLGACKTTHVDGRPGL